MPIDTQIYELLTIVSSCLVASCSETVSGKISDTFLSMGRRFAGQENPGNQQETFPVIHMSDGGIDPDEFSQVYE